MKIYVLINDSKDVLATRFSLEEIERDLECMFTSNRDAATVEVFDPHSEDLFECFTGEILYRNEAEKRWFK